MVDKKRILFVDDEPRVLDGLCRMMRFMRQEWDMSFAQSGQEALDILDGGDFDAIVTDMRMPGMDGGRLLREVRERYPRTARIILSGQASKKAILRSIGSTHQYLSKPSSVEALKGTISRVCALPDQLVNDKLKVVISQVESVPSLPSLYSRLVEELQSSDGSIMAVQQIISQDMGMAARVMQLVNSTILGPHQDIFDPARAVMYLGLEVIRPLVFSVQAFSQFDEAALENLSLESIWKHSAVIGEFARRIARAEEADHMSVDNAFTAGLLHDIGKLILAANLPEEYASALALVSEEGFAVLDAEREVFGSTHAEVSAYLLGLWGLPEPVVIATALHHSSMRSPEKGFSPSAAVHVANILEHESWPADEQGKMSQVDLIYLTETGLAERLPVWRNILQEMVRPVHQLVNQ